MRLPGNRRTQAIVLTVAATLFWPLQETTGGMIIRGHHAAQVVWLRYATHLLLLLVLVLPTRGVRAFATRRPALQLLRGLCMFGMPAAYILAVDITSTRWIWTMFWTMPLMVLAGSALWLRERPPLRAWTATVLGVLGAALALRATPGDARGTMLALCMGASFAGYIVLSRVLREESLSASLLYTALGAGLPMSLVVGLVWTPLQPDDVLAIVATGLLSILILACFDLALEAADLALVAPLIPLVLVWELALAVPLRGAFPGPMELIGLGIVALAFVTMVASHLHATPVGAAERTT